MPRPAIPIPTDRLAEFCQRHHIRKLSLFGSVLRDDFGPDSDVDILVEFEPGHTPGFAYVGVQQELSTMFGRHVDLVSEKYVNRFLRDEVLSTAEVMYDARR